MKRKLFNYTVYCADCRVECIKTENGILCPECGAFVSMEELDNEDIQKDI